LQVGRKGIYTKIALDFDGVLIHHKTVPTRKDWWKDKPTVNALEVVSKWSNNLFNEIYILTAREPEEFFQVRKWLVKYGFSKDIRITNVKEKGTDVFIDDRAIRFTNFMDLSKLIE
jgi:hypothetical protein